MARLVARHGFRKLPNAFATHPGWRWSRRPALPRLFEGNPIAPLVASRSRIERRALTWPDHRGKVAIQRERNGVVAGQRERSRDRVARAEVDGTPSASARAERGRQPRPGRKQLP